MQDELSGLQTNLNSKVNAIHSRAVSDLTGLQTTLDGKANSVHEHSITSVTGLQDELDNLNDDVKGLQAVVNNKMNARNSWRIVND